MRLKDLNISYKISILMLFVVLISVTGISIISIDQRKQTVEHQYIESLVALVDLKAEKLEMFFKNKSSVLDLISQKQSVNILMSKSGTPSDESDYISDDENDLHIIKKSFQLEDIILANASGEIIYSTGQNKSTLAGSNQVSNFDEYLYEQSKKGTYYGRVHHIGNKYLMYIGAPLLDDKSSLKGIVLLEIDMNPVYKLVQDTAGLGYSGESILGMAENNKVTILNPLRHNPTAAMNDSYFFGEGHAMPIQNAARGKDGISYALDYRNKNTLAAYKYIPLLNWGLVTKIDTDEMYANVYGQAGNYMTIGGIIIIISFLTAFGFSQFLTKPLISLKDKVQLLGKGILPDNINGHSNDEIGEMASALGNFTKSLKRTAGFARKIGEGNLDTDFKPMSDEDQLGTALMQMRNNILEAEKKDKERNWIVTGMAEIGDILRTNDELEELGDSILPYFTEKINAIQGAFHVLNDEDEENLFFEMKSCYAYNKKKYLKSSFKFAEGLIGQSAIEKDMILRTEIPEDYVSITSGLLGDQKPSCILINPLITNDEVYGVLEFAGFEKFNESQINFVQELSLIIARTIFNIKVNERTKMHLEESQKMSNELQEQQEVLRQNAVEMEATQEELKTSNIQLEEQIEEVNKAQNRMQILLQNASEVISIYEENGKIRYISPSVKNILGYPQKEMVGKSDMDKVHPSHVKTVENMFSSLLVNPKSQVKIQYEYKKKNQETVWLEATGKNMLSDVAINGIVVNTRDITERRRAEQEQRMRSKMQALSENSPDLITRIEEAGRISYINPVIQSYSGIKPDRFMNKKVQEIELDKSIANEWLNLIGEVKELNGKKTFEMDFPSELGKRVMQVNAIPEYDEQEKLESVLVVSHDITERKLIEIEIQAKNKNISDSINYSKRIQNAMLPDTRVINKKLSDSFILYKPKDIVSGDFPWFTHVGDDIFIAAVDCTGHGVPGAMLSLIGYFLLNDIVKSRKVSDPGLILDLLDEGVTKTLRQDEEDSATKDGMDIALCKINIEKNEVEYAGAHRPLYFMKSGELEEVKGNKFAIGGGIYKNQTSFTTSKIKIKPGDSVYFSSDGFPDQFGGPDVKKFGPRRTRELIVEHHKKPINEVYNIFDKVWEDWKGDQKQIDDVLMIGIKF